MNSSELVLGGGSLPPPLLLRNENLRPPKLTSNLSSTFGTPDSTVIIRTPLGKFPIQKLTRISTPDSGIVLNPIVSSAGTQLINENVFEETNYNFSQHSAHDELVLLEFRLRDFEQNVKENRSLDSNLELAAKECKDKVSDLRTKLVAHNYFTLLNQLDGINKRFESELAQSRSLAEELKTPTVLQPSLGEGEGVKFPHITNNEFESMKDKVDKLNGTVLKLVEQQNKYVFPTFSCYEEEFTKINNHLDSNYISLKNDYNHLANATRSLIEHYDEQQKLVQSLQNDIKLMKSNSFTNAQLETNQTLPVIESSVEGSFQTTLNASLVRIPGIEKLHTDSQTYSKTTASHSAKSNKELTEQANRNSQNKEPMSYRVFPKSKSDIEINDGDRDCSPDIEGDKVLTYFDSNVDKNIVWSPKLILLKNYSARLIKLLNPRSLKSIQKYDKYEILILHKEIFLIQNEIDKLANMLMTYSTSAKFDINRKIEDYVNCCILEAQNWVDLVHLCYNKFQLNIDPIENIPRKPLEKFSRSLDISVFEWITMFEKYIDYKGSDNDRAELLYSDFLSPNLQSEIRDHRKSYAAMKNWLLKNCGDVKFMVAQILKDLDKAKIPEFSAPIIDITNYLRELNNCFKKLKELADIPTIPHDDLLELNTYLYSKEFLVQMVSFCPEELQRKFYDCLHTTNNKCKGEGSFALLADMIDISFQTYIHRALDSGVIQLGSNPSKSNESSYEACTCTSSSSDSDTHERSKKRGRKKRVKDKEGNAKNLESEEDMKIRSKLKNPCPLLPRKNHLHELGTCSEFFCATPYERNKMSYRITCKTCLGQSYKCINKCVNFEKVQQLDLLCLECCEWARENDVAKPNNVLMCSLHDQPISHTFLSHLKSYLKDFQPEMGELIYAK